jgi:two-component system CheB/CheR fusion protein
MCITFFTPAAARAVHLIQGDIGRPIGHVVTNLAGYDRLAGDIKSVLDSLVPFEAEVQSKGDLWYLLRILPFRTLENAISGAVVTFVDITERKRVEHELSEAHLLRRMAVVVRDSDDAITVQDLQGRILAWNPGAVRMYGWSESEALAMNMRKRIPEGRAEKELVILKKIALGKKIEPFQTQRVDKKGRAIAVWLTASALINEAGELYAISTTERKIG